MLHKVVHIEKKNHGTDASVSVLKKYLKNHTKKDITASGASVISGIPIHECERVLLELAKKYPARIQIDREGNLLSYL